MRKTLANFCIDAAKIVFGSLVVGVFAPGVIGQFSWSVWIGGVITTVAFIVSTVLLSKQENDQ